MTVPSVVNRISYAGAGIVGPFAVPFFFLESDDLLVLRETIADGTITTLALTADYSVTGAAVPAGGSVTLVVALSALYRLHIIRDPDKLQSTDYTPNDPFPAETHERAVDKLTMLVQRVYDYLARCLKAPDTESADQTMSGANWLSRAGRVLGFDPLGAMTTYPATATVYGVHRQSFVATAGQRLFNLGFNYVLGVNAVGIWVNGLRVVKDIDFTETAVNQITFLYDLALNDRVEVFGGQEVTGNNTILASLVSWYRGATAVARTVWDWLFDQPVNAADYGALGDGVTDSGPAILAALASVTSGEIRLGRGTFLTSVDIVVPDNKHLVGQGQQATIIKPTVNNLKVLHVTGSFGGVRSLQVNGNGKAGISGLRITPLNEAQVITVVNQNYNRFDDIHIESCAEGVVLQCGPDVAAVDSGCWYNVFTKVHARYCTRGLWLKDGPNAGSASPNRNQFFACRFGELMNTGIQIDAGDTNTFLGCSAEGITTGILPNATPTALKIAFASAWGAGNNQNRFYGFVSEGCTRDIDNANATTEFHGSSYSQASVLFTAKPLEVFPISKDWTPVIKGTGVAGVNTYSNQNGKSQKFGKMVVANATVALSAKDGAMTGSIQITGLPYTIGVGGTAIAYFAYVDFVTLGAGYTELRASGAAGGTLLNLEKSGTAVGQGGIGVADIANNTILTFTVIYWTD